MAKCKLNNCWMASIESAGIGIASPKGGNIFIRKLDVDLISDEHWELVKRCAFHPEPEIELTAEEMSQLLAAAKASHGIVSMGRVVKNVSAPQKVVPQQKTYMQRNAERKWKIANMNKATLQGTCPNCGKGGLKLKHHGTWAGFFCSKCNQGGSITLKK